jgi:hypothetical protein
MRRVCDSELNRVTQRKHTRKREKERERKRCGEERETDD